MHWLLGHLSLADHSLYCSQIFECVPFSGTIVWRVFGFRGRETFQVCNVTSEHLLLELINMKL